MTPQEIIAIQHIILDFIHKHGWIDFENFSQLLSETILKRNPKSQEELKRILKRFNHPFFRFNEVTNSKIVSLFPYDRILQRLQNLPTIISQPIPMVIVQKDNVNVAKKNRQDELYFADLFPEIKSIDKVITCKLLPKLKDISERTIQNELRDALREKGAKNIVERISDTSLEVADLEHFTLRIQDNIKSFVMVVKGYSSSTANKIRYEDIAHQIMRAYQRTEPDHVVLVVAKDFVDSIVSELTKYGQTVGKEHLIIICDRIDLTRFLLSRGIF